jgi:hypothetical protein
MHGNFSSGSPFPKNSRRACAAIPRLVCTHRHASLKCQFDAFADYVNEAERLGPEHYPLYHWTKETIEKPEKKARYLRSFTLYVDGAEVYDKVIADPLQAELTALVGVGGVENVVKFDTDPANSPQPPAR